METRACIKCGNVRDLISCFTLNKKTNTYYPRCKSCRAEDARVWRATHPERVCDIYKKYNDSDKGKKRYKVHRPKAAIQNKKWRQDNLEKSRGYAAKHKAKVKLIPEKVANLKKVQLEYDLSHNYGISLEEYNFMLSSQGGACLICHKPPSPHGKQAAARLHVDHDHETKDIRGLLCGKCNTGIGLLCDSLTLLKSAIAYLEAYEEKRIARFISTLPEEEIENLKAGSFE